MKWTSETPKVEGWYWQRICLHPARVVKLWQSQQDGRWWFDEAGNNWSQPVLSFHEGGPGRDLYWAGPIPEPEE